MTEHKTQTQRQAEADAAHLCLVLAEAHKLGLCDKKGAVDSDACRELLEEQARAGIIPRHDLLVPAKMLAEICDLRQPDRAKLFDGRRVNVTVDLLKVKREECTDVQGLWALLAESARNRVPDIAVCKQWILLKIETHWYLLAPEILFTAVVERFGIPVQDKADWQNRFSL